MQKQLYKIKFLFLLSCFCLGFESQKHYRSDEAPQALKDIGVTENLGAFVDLNLEFTNFDNKKNSLKQIFQSRPVLLTIVYYECPTLCNFHLNGLFESLNQMEEKPGSSYAVVVVSMDPSEGFQLAAKKRASYLEKFLPGADEVYFLTGSESQVNQLSKQLGFRFKWSEESQQFAHSPVAYTISPKGKISRYLYGVEFDPKTLSLAVAEAGDEKTRNIIDKIRLFCYRFDPKQSKYTLYAYNIMRAGAFFMVLLLLGFLVPFWLKQRMKI